MGMEHPVEAPLRTDIEALIRQDRHDLPRGQRREFGLVAGEQDPLPLFFCEAMGNHPMAAFTAIHAVPITSELPLPALQGAQTHPQKTCQSLGPGTSGQPGFQNLQGPLAIFWGGQSSPSSPQ
jgi:hypothetical protein